MNKKRLYLFLFLVIIASWSLISIIPLSGDKYGSAQSIIIMSVMMLIPAISSIITRIVTKEGFKDMYLKPRFKNNMKYYLVAYFMTNIFIIFGAVIYFLIFPQNLDWNMTTIQQTLSNNGMDINPKVILIIQLAQGIFIGPIINIIFTLGEELGWRGYLLQKLCKEYSTRKSIIISGFIWGIWHAPIIAMGHNYGTNYFGAPWFGIFAMIVFCIFMGSYLSYLVIKTQSVIPCAIAHSALNGFAAIGLLVYKGVANPFIGPSPTGIIGGSIFIIVGTYCYISVGKIENPFNKELSINS